MVSKGWFGQLTDRDTLIRPVSAFAVVAPGRRATQNGLDQEIGH